jgi:5-methylcytosine-specific restriction endonuclease McrA
MPKRPATFRPRGAPSKQQIDLDRGSARERGYDRTWSAASIDHRRRHPLCAYCELRGRVTAATLVDHLYPHRVYAGVFWNREWWVSSCAPCHSGFKQALERRGRRALDDLADRLGRPRLDGARPAGGGWVESSDGPG